MRVTDKFVFFWTKKDFPSQWYPAQFDVKGIVFPNAEAYMMFCKSIMFQYNNISASEAIEVIKKERVEAGLPELQVGFAREPSNLLPDGSLSAILETDDPSVAKAQGRLVKGFDKKRWDNAIPAILKSGNRAKYTQNPKILKKFIAYAGLTFVEASPYDKLYGIGMKENHPDAETPSKWKGENKLGYVLTDLANELAVSHG